MIPTGPVIPTPHFHFKGGLVDPLAKVWQIRLGSKASRQFMSCVGPGHSV